MEIKPKFKPDPGLKLMGQVREVLRYHHYAYRTEKENGKMGKWENGKMGTSIKL